MTTRVGINGFGRIGRQSLKALIERAPDIEVVAVNDLVDAEMNALLFKHDSTYGTYRGSVEAGDQSIIIDGREIKILAEKDPAALPWARPRRRHRPREHGPLHERREGQGAPRRRREEGHHQRPGQGRGHHDRPRRQRRALRPGHPPHHQQRQLHDELPRPGGQGRPRPRRHREGPDEHDPQLHQRPAHPRRRAQGPAPRPQRRPEHHPDDDRRGQGARPRHPGAQGQVRRLQPARPDPDGQRRRLHRDGAAATRASRSSTTRSGRPPPAR